jgi:Heterokaryon incompatibility protein (HET)
MAASKKLLCDVCHGLSLQRSDFEASVFEPVRKLKQVILRDTLGALRARAIQCAFCQLILHVLEKNENLPESFLQDTQWEDPFRDPGLASLRALQESTWDISDAREWKLYWYWCQNGSGWTQKMVNSQSALFSNFENSKNRYHCIQLVDDAGTAGYRRARRVSDHINIGMLQGWLDRCIREHDPSCKETGLAVSNHPNTGAVPFLVIDVAENRLAKLPLEAKYATLSYVWGPENWPRTAQSNIQEFMQHGALARLQLPATISDAIQVAHRLGCRYLWVDSLCIVQDDPMKNQTIASMDSVYEHAEVTIVAASGHCAQDGLPGWTDLSVRVQRLRPVDIQPDFSVGVVQRYGIATEGCPHRSRAWT